MRRKSSLSCLTYIFGFQLGLQRIFEDKYLDILYLFYTSRKLKILRAKDKKLLFITALLGFCFLSEKMSIVLNSNHDRQVNHLVLESKAAGLLLRASLEHSCV